MSLDIANVIWGYGSAAADFGNFAPSLALFGIGLVLFTAHYLMLRGFYALEQTRRVFWIQCGIAATNIVAAVLLTRGAPPAETAPRLVIAYALLVRGRCRDLLRDALAHGRRARRPPAGALPGAAGDRGRRSAPRPPGGCAKGWASWCPARAS